MKGMSAEGEAVGHLIFDWMHSTGVGADESARTKLRDRSLALLAAVRADEQVKWWNKGRIKGIKEVVEVECHLCIEGHPMKRDHNGDWVHSVDDGQTTAQFVCETRDIRYLKLPEAQSVEPSEKEQREKAMDDKIILDDRPHEGGGT